MRINSFPHNCLFLLYFLFLIYFYVRYNTYSLRILRTLIYQGWAQYGKCNNKVFDVDVIQYNWIYSLVKECQWLFSLSLIFFPSAIWNWTTTSNKIRVPVVDHKYIVLLSRMHSLYICLSFLSCNDISIHFYLSHSGRFVSLKNRVLQTKYPQGFQYWFYPTPFNIYTHVIYIHIYYIDICIYIYIYSLYIHLFIPFHFDFLVFSLDSLPEYICIFLHHLFLFLLAVASHHTFPTPTKPVCTITPRETMASSTTVKCILLSSSSLLKGDFTTKAVVSANISSLLLTHPY